MTSFIGFVISTKDNRSADIYWLAGEWTIYQQPICAAQEAEGKDMFVCVEGG